jgi:transposase-like protein
VADDLGVASVGGELAAAGDLYDGHRDDGLTTAEREELGRLRCEVCELREEREILREAAACFASETDQWLGRCVTVAG